jgi:hypothetical protein
MKVALLHVQTSIIAPSIANKRNEQHGRREENKGNAVIKQYIYNLHIEDKD